MAPPPVLFAFGVHLHQPVGNFDSVFREHLDQVYEPLLRTLKDDGLGPATLHLSGPLLEWLEAHAGTWLDRIGTLVVDGRLELLLSGYDEPVLAALPREDRLDQIGRMRHALSHRFGVNATGLWLTERVWEPDLAADLVDAGVAYVVVDDRHFLTTGFERDQLHQSFRTEADGRRLALFPIDERLRYLVPFRPALEFAEYIEELRTAGHRLAVLADDGEKFGGWPGTFDWVYTRGWMRSWREVVDRLVSDGVLRLVTFREALDTLPSGGLAYLPTASYREMEGWALPPRAAGRLLALEAELGERMSSPTGALVRGAHWRNFLVKYPEANRMHKTMLRLSALCRSQGDPPQVRREIGLAQCNDAYWHGVFGGLYLPFLRGSVWRHLARAERALRRDEGLSWETADVDWDGHDEILVTSSHFSAVIAPKRGGGIERLLRFDTEQNHADVLTRRREVYHTPTPLAAPGTDTGGTPSIHDIEKWLAAEDLPPEDREPRALFQERLLLPGVTPEAWQAGDWEPLRTWVRERFEAHVGREGSAVVVTLTAPGLVKRYRFLEDGALDLELEWRATDTAEGARFTTELSLSGEASLGIDAPEATVWSYPVETLAKSERGFDRTHQGVSITLGWPAESGIGTVRLTGR